MDFFRAGEALLRSSQPLLPFLAPSAYRVPTRPGAISRHCRAPQRQCEQARRTFSTPQSLQQQSAAARRQEEDGPPRPAASPDDDMFAMFDKTLDRDKGVPGTPAGRTSHFRSPRAQQASRQPAPESQSYPKDSIQELLTDMLEDTPRRQRSGEQRQPETPSATKRRSSASSSFDALDIESIFKISENTTSKSSTDPPPPTKVEPLPFKLNSSVGRTIPVRQDQGMDIGRAFRMLEMRCAQNSVRKDMMRQRFHERPGLKRKRLKSERWRRRFKEDFQGTVRMVMKMKAQGW